LLSSIEVKTIEDAYERIFWYSLRWQIESVPQAHKEVWYEDLTYGKAA
jgi:hypothetical protein